MRARTPSSEIMPERAQETKGTARAPLLPPVTDQPTTTAPGRHRADIASVTSTGRSSRPFHGQTRRINLLHQILRLTQARFSGPVTLDLRGTISHPLVDRWQFSTVVLCVALIHRTRPPTLHTHPCCYLFALFIGLPTVFMYGHHNAIYSLSCQRYLLCI